MTQLLELIQNTGKNAKHILSEFVDSQKQSWPLAAANFDGLERVEVKHFQFDGFQIVIQFNPERMLSTSSKTDKESIATRPCFLCSKNRPLEQGKIDFGDQLEILVNPFPIFKLHFTIVSIDHIEQRFLVNAPQMFRLAESLQGFTVLYNGPECGASAPDHFHFQAGESALLPIAEEFGRLKNTSRIIFSGVNTTIYAFDNYLRKMISIETTSIAEGLEVIDIYYKYFQAMQPDKIEPMMNALCSWINGKWMIHLFPRKAHRPTHYFEYGAKQILISPGSVDFGGVFILPRREDFDKISKENMVDILAQVCLNQDVFLELTEKMRNDLSKFV